MIMCL